MKKFLAISVIAALSTQVHAVRLGDDVNESDYRDYIVRFQVADTSDNISSCGGLLVGGEYIITAGHCVGDYHYNGTNIEYLYFVDNGADNTITISQGVNYNDDISSRSYQVVDFINLNQVRDTAYAEGNAVKVANAASGFDWSIHDARYTNTYTLGAFHYDIALLKLNTKVDQQFHAAITPAYDSISNSFNVAAEDTFTFRGWGRDENNQVPSKMQETEITWGSTNATWLNNTSYIPNMPRINPNIAECANAGDLCTYGMMDYARFFPNTIGGTPSRGDSGTPLEIAPNKVVALAKSEHTAGLPEYVDFTHYGWYLPSLVAQIDKLAAPTKVDFSFAKSATDNQSHTFAIQNLSTISESIAPLLTGDTERFEVAGCNQTLASMESCEITVTAKPAPQSENISSQSTSDEANVTLSLGDSAGTSFPISSTVSTAESGGESGNGGSGGGGGGGSTGIITMLALAGLLFRRKHR